MWALKNKTPFAAAKAFDRDKVGRESMCLAVRATLRHRDDGLWTLAETQNPILLAPELGETEMIADADIVPFLPGAEVALRCHITDRLPSDGQLAQLTVGGIQQQARFWPARQARQLRRRIAVEDMDAAPLPLLWAHAAGGALPDGLLHPANPVGTGLSFPPDHAPIPLPRILGAADKPDALKPDARPVGFGPIHRHWSPRLEAAGTYDAEWEATQAPCLPRDFDPRFYFSAPPNLQQKQPFRGGEPLVLAGFGERQDMRARLPSVLITSVTDFGKEQVEHRLSLRRIGIDLDAGTVALMWLAAVPCDGRDHLIRSATLYLKQSSGIVL